MTRHTTNQTTKAASLLIVRRGTKNAWQKYANGKNERIIDITLNTPITNGAWAWAWAWALRIHELSTKRPFAYTLHKVAVH